MNFVQYKVQSVLCLSFPAKYHLHFIYVNKKKRKIAFGAQRTLFPCSTHTLTSATYTNISLSIETSVVYGMNFMISFLCQF